MSINLSIKNVPEALADKLRARAERNHRSLQGELMAIIESAVSDAARPDAAAGESQPRRGGTKTLEQIAAEHRARYPEPLAGLPRSADILRELRDSR
jgi:plasmid stability protein